MDAGAREGGRERVLWALVALAALSLAFAPGWGLAPASALPLAQVVRGWLRLAAALPVLVLGLGIAPVRFFGPADRLAATALGMTVAPLAWALIGAAATRAHGDFGTAGRVALIVSAVLSAGSAWRAPRVAALVAVPAERTPRALLAAVLICAGAVALLFAANPYLAHRSDAWLHAAFTYRIDALGWPPDDPFYVGLPLRYFWAFHLALGTLAGAAGATPFAAGAAVGVLAAGAVALWLGVVARDLCGRRAMVPAVALALLGLNPLGWPVWLARGLFGREAGAHVLARAWQDGARGSLGAIDLRYPHVSVGFGPDKFLVVTAFGLGLAAALAFAWCALVDPRRGGWRTGLAAGLAAASAFFLHGVLGVALLAAGCVALLVARIGGGRGAFPAAIGLGAAALCALPYAALCSAGGGEAIFRLGVSPGLVWTWLVSGGFVLLLALPELAAWRRAGERVAERSAYAAAIAVAALMSLVVPLVKGNETKFFNLGATLLAVPAAGGWVRLAGTRAGTAARVTFFCLCVPTAALGLVGFLTEHGLDVYGRMRPPAAESQAYRWLATHADRRAGVIEMPADARGDVDLDVMVHARRGLVWGGPDFGRRWGYSALQLAPRAALAGALADGSFGPRDEALLATLAAHGVTEFYLVRRTAQAGGGGPTRPLPPFPPPPWTSVFQNRSLVLYRFGEGAPQLAARPEP